MAHFYEEAYILTGEQRGGIWLLRCHRHMAGTPASVEADWQWALRREERYQDVVGFYHTHPPSVGSRPSGRDARTMRAWCGAFGKPLLCVIAAGQRIQTTLYADEESKAADWR
jgi:proteasome lid subunit RPN8/RPN11